MREFKNFALKGNLLDLVIGIALAGGLVKLCSAFVADVVMPLLNRPCSQGFNWNGPHLFQALVDFIFLSLVLYLLFHFVHRMRKASPGNVSTLARQEQLLTEIRDLLKKKDQ
jgi:large conductance mechanosensitive channel protein